MLFCCLRHNVETSCHKYFVVVSRHQQTPPLTSSGNCHNLPQSGGTVLITPNRPQRWQHAMKLDIGSESWFLPTPHAFDAPVRSDRNIAMTFSTEKLELCGYPMVEKFWRYVYSLYPMTTLRHGEARPPFNTPMPAGWYIVRTVQEASDCLEG